MSEQNPTQNIDDLLGPVVAEYNRRISALTEELVLRTVQRDQALKKIEILEPQLTQLLAAQADAADAEGPQLGEPIVLDDKA